MNSLKELLVSLFRYLKTPPAAVEQPKKVVKIEKFVTTKTKKSSLLVMTGCPRCGRELIPDLRLVPEFGVCPICVGSMIRKAGSTT